MRVRSNNQTTTAATVIKSSPVMETQKPQSLKGFDLSHPDNFDLNVIVSLSSYFNKVSLEYFSRILHSYSLEILHLSMPEADKHYYYRSCMNIYAACLYQMFSQRAKEELTDYIRKKKKFLNATNKFEVLASQKRSKTKKSKNPIKTSPLLSLSKSSISKKSSTTTTNTNNKLSEILQKNIIASEPLLHDYKLLRYQSHVLGNIAEANILDYLFINYINTSKFVSNLNFISRCFVSSFEKAENIIKRKQDRQHTSSSPTDSTSSKDCNSINSLMINSIGSTLNTPVTITKMKPLNIDNINLGSNSDGDDLNGILSNTNQAKKISKRFSNNRQKMFRCHSSKNNDLNMSENDSNDVSSVDSTQSELLH